MGKSLSNKYSQKLLDSAKKSTTGAIKTASKRAIQQTAEEIGDKMADKITSVSKKKPAKELPNDETKEEEDVKITTHKKSYISPEERQKTIDELGLVPKKDAYFKKIIDELMLTLKNIHISKRKTTNY